ncbi:MAG: hypothetical protein B6D65_01185 [candidate division Zixibacteria bacterium 4484_93]|nr:MAG: hypothetical protein B6D65_01185 [candidate division Zixibacteria bacterium 4484_93]
MNLRETLRTSSKQILSNPVRGLLTILGIVIGIVAVVAMISFTESLRRELIRSVEEMGSTSFYVERFPPFMRGGITVRVGRGASKKIDWRAIWRRPRLELYYGEQIKENCPSVAEVAPILHDWRKVKSRFEETQGVPVIGTSYAFAGAASYDIVSGRFLAPQDNLSHHYVCIIGEELADELFPKRDPMGKSVKIGKYWFQIIGVYREQWSAFGYNKNKSVIIPVEAAGRVFHRLNRVKFLIRARSSELLPQAIEEVRFTVRILRKLRPEEPDNFEIITQEDMLSMMGNLTGIIFIVLVSIASISLLVGGIGIMNIMLVSVIERTKEIGIRKALGAPPSTILLQFATESAFLSMAGGIIGVGVVFLLVWIANRLAPFPIYIPLWGALLGVGFSILVGLIFGISPAKRAAKLNPADALRAD